jgi:hypothetical protein
MGIINIVGRLDVVYNDFKVAVPAWEQRSARLTRH